MSFPGIFYRISILLPAKLICTWIGAIFCSSKKRLGFSSAVLTNNSGKSSSLPRLHSISTLSFSSFGGFEPFTRFRKLNSSFFKVKSSFLPMSFKVFGAVKHFKVFDLVVIFVSIFVMNVHAYGNRTMVVDPYPSLGVNGHVVYPVAVFLSPKGFSKVLPFFEFTHTTSISSKWLIIISKIIRESQAEYSHFQKKVSLIYL